jgi:hypothetical protein
MQQISRSILVRSACALALGLAIVAVPQHALAQVSVSITLAPPALPVYEQPVLVADGGIWTPGYWDYGPEGYFWVPGTWIQPPELGLLWTPGYWGWGNGAYAWNAGYWGAEVGFYGGVNYGFGYSGQGYAGGHWDGGHFAYNTAVSHVNVTNIHNTYSETVVNNSSSHVSFNGGTGGTTARPTAAETAAARAPHQPATAAQVAHRQSALSNHALLASVNHGKPAILATARPVAGNERPEGKATAAVHERATPKVAEKPAPVHARDVPAVARKTAPSSGDAERDRAAQKEQDTLRSTQEKQRQELQEKQAQEHAQAAKQPASAASAQELERQHQSQTQALVQRHATEQKTLSDTQAKRPEEKREGPTR